MLPKIIPAVIVIVCTLLSGFFDSRGFLYASDVWENGSLAFGKMARSAGSFTLGFVFYWVVIRYLKELNIGISTEVQTLGWFGVTMIAIAITSGAVLKWAPVDRLVALAVMLGIGWLLFRGN